MAPGSISFDAILSQDARRALPEIFSSIGICVLSLLPPACILYLAMLALTKRKIWAFERLSWLSVVSFLSISWMVPIRCAVVKSLQLWGVAIGIIKAVDLFVRRHSPPLYACEDHPSDAMIALYYLTELRYESFRPNFIRIPPGPSPPDEKAANLVVKGRRRSRTKASWIQELHFSERTNLFIHAGFIAILQTFFPQTNPTVVGFQVPLAIYVIWESLQLVLRYRSSPPLFGPMYKATSLSKFWSETWHSAFSSPCRSLAYMPVRQTLPQWGVPVPFARAAGIIASFVLMGFFHVYALKPLLPIDALFRICAFFLLNGVGTVIEDAFWGRKSHWGKALLAWIFELAVATWTVEGLSVPRGLRNISWSSVCDVGNVGASSTMFPPR